MSPRKVGQLRCSVPLLLLFALADLGLPHAAKKALDCTESRLLLAVISLSLELFLGLISNSFLPEPAMLGSRGVVGDKWSQRILWVCAIGSAMSLYMVAVERQAQNRERMMAEGLKGIDGSSSQSGENV